MHLILGMRLHNKCMPLHIGQQLWTISAALAFGTFPVPTGNCLFGPLGDGFSSASSQHQVSGINSLRMCIRIELHVPSYKQHAPLVQGPPPKLDYTSLHARRSFMLREASCFRRILRDNNAMSSSCMCWRQFDALTISAGATSFCDWPPVGAECCLGTMTWGGDQNSLEDASEQLSFAFDAGVNFIDTAEM